MIILRTFLPFLFIACLVADTHRPTAADTPAASILTEPLPCRDEEVPRYKAYQRTGKITVDGKLTERAWQNAPRSNPFVDLVHGTPTHLDTRAAVIWDDTHLYVGYWIEEPHVKATLTERDAPIYKDNDVELFIAGSDGYYEFEINALGTIYEVLFFWEEAFERKGYADMPEFDRSRPEAKPFNGVGYRSHPRGRRIGFWSWDYPGLRKAVHVYGTLNNGNDMDKGWTVELALPWSGLEILAKGDGRSLPPKDGDVWRMDFSRFNTYKAPPPSKDSGGWAWSSHGVWDSHVPECFTYVEFKTKGLKR
jgi:hypothetical protein